MTNEEAKKKLEAKLKCLIAETSGTNYDCNMRLCDGCSLNYEQGNMGEQKQALDMAIKALEQQSCENINEDYDDCDQFKCSECQIELQDWHRVERDEDYGEISYHEYTFKYCPNCGRRVKRNEADY